MLLLAWNQHFVLPNFLSPPNFGLGTLLPDNTNWVERLLFQKPLSLFLAQYKKRIHQSFLSRTVWSVDNSLRQLLKRHLRSRKIQPRKHLEATVRAVLWFRFIEWLKIGSCACTFQKQFLSVFIKDIQCLPGMATNRAAISWHFRTERGNMVATFFI